MIASLLLIAVQAQPLPGDPMASPVPIERPQREAAQPVDAPGPSAKLRACLQTTLSDPQAALLSAREWRLEAQGLARAEAIHCEGMALLQAGRLDEAQTAFVEGHDAIGDDRQAYRARLSALAGLAAMNAGRPADAFDLLGQARGEAMAAGASTLALELALDQALAAQAAGDVATATAMLADLRERDPNTLAVWLASIQTAREARQYEDAARYIAQARALAPGNREIDLEAGLLAWAQGDRVTARETFRQVASSETPYSVIAERFLSQMAGEE